MKIDLIENKFNTQKKYEIIYADPPWSFKNKKTGGSFSSGASQKYSCMSIDDICNMNVGDISAENSVLTMWWVASMPAEALRVVDAWGFKLKTMTCFSWIKKTKNWKDHFGMGFSTRQQQEHCLVAVKGKPIRMSASVRQNVREYTGVHSEKPRSVLRHIETLYDDGVLSKVELFARKKTPGWDYIGDECD